MKFGAPVKKADIPASNYGVMADSKKQLLELLQDSCLTHADIARRFGVSRERMRQLAWKLTGKTGREQRSIRTVNRKMEKWEALPFVKACREQGLSIVEEDFRRDLFRVENKLCAVAKASSGGMGKRPYRFWYWRFRRPDKDADIYVWKAGTDWLIVPVEFAPVGQTSFSKETLYEQGKSNINRHGAHSKKHYKQWLNAWGIFRNEGRSTCPVGEDSARSGEVGVRTTGNS